MESLNVYECSNFVYQMMCCDPFYTCENPDYYNQYYMLCEQTTQQYAFDALYRGMNESNDLVNRYRHTCSRAIDYVNTAMYGSEYQMRTLMRKTLKKQRRNFIFNPNSERQQSLRNEEIAMQVFMDNNPYVVKRGGVMVNPRIPFICGSTDGFIVENNQVTALVEVKSPKRATEMPIDEWYDKNGEWFGLRWDGWSAYFLNPNSTAWFQIQMQLAVSNLPTAYLVVSSTDDGSIIPCRVERDDVFIDNALEMLEHIYKFCIQPYIYTDIYYE